MDKRNIFVLGDSISIHYGPYLKKVTKGKFHYDRKRGIDQALTDLDSPTGANGGDSNKVLEYLIEQNEIGISYDILLINCGLHDIRVNKYRKVQQTELPEYKENLRKIVKVAKKMSNDVVWIESTPVVDEIHNSISKTMKRYNKDLLIYNSAASKIMKENGINIIPLYDFTKKLGNEAYCDHIHFTEETREKQAEFIKNYLEKI